ncbi:MAG: amidohydrolase 2 [Frankiales bacterium]|nr:amidohydrolase 2 [Frankiales bacterium]
MHHDVLADADVPGVWQQLGLPGLIDVHVHFMPKPVMDKVWAYFDGSGPLTGVDWPIAYRTEELDRLGRLRAMGVLAFPSLVYAHKPGMSAWLNAWAAELATQHDDVLRTMTFYPEPEALAYVTQGLADGVQVVKVHVQVGDFDPSDRALDGIWGVLADAGVPVVTHCGSGPAPGRFTGPARFAAVLARHPSLTAVVAHMGMPEYGEFLDLADRYPRLHLDTTMVFTDFAETLMPFPPELRPRLLALQDRILLGSDFPNTPHPYAHQVESLIRLDLGDAWLRQVLHHNAAGLLKK